MVGDTSRGGKCKKLVCVFDRIPRILSPIRTCAINVIVICKSFDLQHAYT